MPASVFAGGGRSGYVDAMTGKRTFTIAAADAYDLLEPALIYALPRMSGIVSDARGWIGSLWPALTRSERARLLVRIDEEFGKQVENRMWMNVDRTGWEAIVALYTSRLDEQTRSSAELTTSLTYALLASLLRVALREDAYDKHGEPHHADTAGSYRAIELVGRYGVQLEHAHEIALYVREIADQWEAHPGYSYDLRER